MQVPHHMVKTKFPGDTKAYYKFTLNDDEATQFACWCDADMARIMLQMPHLEIINDGQFPVSAQYAMNNGTYHSLPESSE